MQRKHQVALNESGRRKGSARSQWGIGLEKAFEILVDQIRAWDNRRFLEKLEKLNSVKALEIRGKLGAVMDF